MHSPTQTKPWEVAFGLAAAALLVLVGFHVLIDYTRTWDYNAVRLQRSLVLLSDAPLYPGPESGAILNTIYGPVGALAYLPAAAMRTPAAAVLAGQVLASLFFFLPVAALHLRGRSLLAAFGFLLFAALAVDLRPLEYVAFSIHVDAPALALAILAWGAMVGSEMPRFWLAAALALVSVVMVVGFGPADDLFFNMWTVPSLQTLEAEPAAWGRAVYRLLNENAVAWLLWSGLVVWRLTCRRAGWRRDPACSYGFLGLSLVPLAVLAFLKPGGDINAFSYPVYFLAAGATLSLVAAARREGAARRLLVAAPAVVLAIVATVQEPEFLRTWREPLDGAELPHQAAYEYLLENPGELWFPRITLASFMAEGEVYHQSVGLLDRRVAGLPPSAEHLWAHVPSAMEGIAFYENGFAGEIGEIDLPEFCCPAPAPDLPGFVVYRREP